ncbi:TPA: 50S ribosomal protein L15 [Candidatus Poribacteria bacterium]|mgnify:FL=1|jgi:large subunit ribosomal protein L15|nr:50S ribosomal protein L15 [Candidatus Poribacteria bacterium]|tara:strand:+ start:925 stop:1371 length:447 start_codon:yes stop_codon:yes gene_type:complete
MKLNELKPPKGSRRPKKRVGRGHGSGWGKTCGRGHKGQKSRSGASIPAWFEGGQMPLVRRIPKSGPRRIGHVRIEYSVVNIQTLSIFEDGATVSLETMFESGIVKGKNSRVKILGDGEIEKKLTVQAHKFSKTAVEKIEAVGGTVEVI